MPNVREAGRPARRCATLVAALLLALVPFGAGAPGINGQYSILDRKSVV